MRECQMEESLQGLFMQTAHIYAAKTFSVFREMDIHPKQVPLIGILYMNEGISQRELSSILKIKPPTVAVSLKRLEGAGIVERHADENDQRMSRVYLTKCGKELAERSRQVMRENEEKIFSRFSESEKCLMKRFLHQMIENLES